jgi:hypothetical protein
MSAWTTTQGTKFFQQVERATTSLPICKTQEGLNPLEKKICIFGQELLGAMGNDLPLVFGRMVRKNGEQFPVDPRKFFASR